MREIELKLELSQQAARELLHSGLFRGAHGRPERLHAIYFDTSDRLLQAHGMALRVRHEGGGWVQCLKAGRSAQAGLHSRDEWEWPRPDATIDPGLLRDTPLAALLARKKLRPMFEVDMHRATVQLEPSRGNRVEVALDRGAVRRGRKRAAICEVEIESISGNPLAVFDIAERLVGKVPMRASAVGKAQRGYALSHPPRPAPVKASHVTLRPDSSVHEAARAVIAAALAQLQGNEALAGATDAHVEYLHQFRVGLRRLRTALRIFGGEFEGADAQRIRRDCRWLSLSTGAARDLDVFVDEILPRLLEGTTQARKRAATTRALDLRDAARKRFRDALATRRYTRLMLRFARWLATPHERSGDELRNMARKALQRQHVKAMRELPAASGMKPGERHRLRVRLKRLRYACEALASVFGHERGGPYVKALARLQQDLGRAADARVGMRLLESLRLPAAQARTAMARLDAAERTSLRGLEAHIDALRAAEPFWHDRTG